MSDTKREVTVYDRTPSTLRISVAQVDRYLSAAGWRMHKVSRFGRHWCMHGGTVFVRSSGNGLSSSIDDIARAEGRQPSAVLADIAQEPAS